MNEIANSLIEAFKRRTTSAALGTYSFFWVCVHWQAVYATLFVSQDLMFKKFGLLKNEYVHKYFFNVHGWRLVWSYVLPLILTVIFIWGIQKYLLIIAYKEEQNSKFHRRRIKLKEEQNFIDSQKQVTLEKEAAIDAEISLTEKTQAAEDTWEKDYKAFMKDDAYDTFAEIIDSVYEHGGHIRDYYDSMEGNIDYRVTKEALSLADSNGLIDLNTETQLISLTAKGKYFVKRYSAENPTPPEDTPPRQHHNDLPPLQ